MRRSVFIIFFFTGLCGLKRAGAQSSWAQIDLHRVSHTETRTEKGYTLAFISLDTTFDPNMQQRLIRTFFAVYPTEVAAYNPEAARRVYVVIDPAYDGVAATDAAIIRISPAWLRKHPDDIDIVTHEAMHIVQAYPNSSGPGWLTEGIADYVRYRYGVANGAAGWSLPAYAASQHYDNSYRVTARFLAWLERNFKEKQPVKTPDNAMRNGSYNDALWKNLLGKSVDVLWSAYAAHPEL